MAENIIQIEWKHYENTVQSSFQNLYNDETFTDVTLVCEGDKSVQAHKVVLQEVSDFFSEILKLNSNPKPLIYLQGISYIDLISFKEFIYLGRANVHKERSDTFMKVAMSLMLKYKDFKDGEESNHNSELDEQNIKQEGERIHINLKTDEKIESMLNESNMSESLLKQGKTSEICKDCSYVATNKSKMAYHTSKTHLKIKFTCDTCGLQYSTRNKVDKCRHGNEQTTIKKLLFCDQCDFSTKWNGELSRHNKKHKGELLFCDECGYSCTRNFLLKSHIESKHRSNEYSCDQCKFTGTTQKKVKFHTKKCHLGIRYECKMCDYKATVNSNLQVHIRAVHEKIRFYCEYCNFKDQVESRVILHTKKEHIKKELSVQE